MKQKYILLLTLLLIGLCIAGLFIIFKRQSLENIIHNHQKNNPLSGVILIADQNNILYLKAFGFANKEQNIKNDLNSEFLLASITKQFTAAGILLLAEKGLINLNEPVSTYLPNTNPIWGNTMPKWAKTITIHHLLSHSAGLAEYVTLPGFDTFYCNPHTTAELIQFFAYHPVNFSPGGTYEYSGSGYNLLGAIIETVSGKSYSQFLADNFFAPLNLKNIYAHHSQMLSDLQKDRPLISHGYNYNSVTKQIETAGMVNLSTAFSEASVISNATDFYQWLHALYTGKLISDGMLKKMTTAYFTIEDNLGVGYGIYIDPNKGNLVYVHTGRINGYEAITLYSPVKKIYVIILSNLKGSNIFELGYSLIDFAAKKVQ